MASIEYKDSSLGLTIAFDLAPQVLSLNITSSVWYAVARVIIESINLLLGPVKKLIFRVKQVRKDIIVEWEKSKACIRAEKLMAITLIYESEKARVETLSLSMAAKQKLIANLDKMLDKHVQEIIEVG